MVARLGFVMDEGAHKATSLVLQQGGRELPAKRIQWRRVTVERGTGPLCRLCSPPSRSRLDVKTAPLLLLPAVPLLLAAGVLYWMRVRGYVVSCGRTVQGACSLERTEAAGTTRTLVPLGPDASAVVRVQPPRRGEPRVLLYLEAPNQSVFAAEFEDEDAQATAATAAAQLNRVLHGATPGPVRIEVTPSPLYRWLSWAVISFMGLLLLAAYWQARSRPAEQRKEGSPRGAA